MNSIGIMIWIHPPAGISLIISYLIVYSAFAPYTLVEALTNIFAARIVNGVSAYVNYGRVNLETILVLQ